MAEQTLAYVISATDRSAPALESFKRSLQAADREYARMAQRFQQGGQQAQKDFKSTAGQADALKRAISTMADQAARDLARLAAHANLVRSSFSALSAPVRVITDLLSKATLGGTAIAAAFGVMGIKANIFKENTLAGLQAMLKSRGAAEDMFNFLSRFADVTPFDDQEVTEAGRRLIAFGFDAKRTLGIVGDAAAAMKIPLDQVVNALAKLRAGTFDIAEMAPVGITREGLERRGVQFNPSGEPRNRGALLGAGLALLRQQFGGMMAASQHGFDAISSTMVSNIRRLSRMVTAVLFDSLKPAFQSVSNALEKLMAGDNAEKLRKALTFPFSLLGKMIEFVAGQFPRLVDYLSDLSNRWPQVWEAIGRVTINIAKLIGGTISGIINVFRELFDSQIAGTQANQAMADSFKGLAIAGVKAVAEIIVQVGRLQMLLGGVIAAIGIIAKNPMTFAKGAEMLVSGLAVTQFTKFVTNQAVKGIQGIDTTNIAKTLSLFANQPGPIGAFSRGFTGFGKTLDDLISQAMSPSQPIQAPPGPNMSPRVPVGLRSNATGRGTIISQSGTPDGGIGPFGPAGARQIPNTGAFKDAAGVIHPAIPPYPGTAGAGVHINVPLTVVVGTNLNDPQLRKRIHDEVDERLDELYRQRAPN